ncbi:MAG: hypothetical protein ACKOAD_04970, partial [Gammaproteobacteria bacterium]
MLATSNWAFTGLIVFFITYTLVAIEELLHLRKSKPVIIGGSLMWILFAGHVYFHDPANFSLINEKLLYFFQLNHSPDSSSALFSKSLE